MKTQEPHGRIDVFKNHELLCDVVCQKILALSKDCIQKRGRFTIALAGGGTPKGLYVQMAGPDYRNEFDWHNIHFFWGDERWVPPDHVKSNYHMAANALLTRVDIPVENIHFIHTKAATPEEGALRYEKDLDSFFSAGEDKMPVFDLMLLGLGQDGHVASLFPHTPALHETRRRVVAVSVKDIEEPRITLTFPVINHSRNIYFLVSGREKAEVLGKVLEHEGQPDLPAEQVKPSGGHLFWFVDRYAASLLKNKPETILNSRDR